MGAGRPTEYKESYDKLAEKACEIFGADDKKLARFLEVCKATVENWKKEHPKFLDSIKRGKDVFDTRNVEKSLLERALGFEYEEVHTEISEGADGKQRKAVKKIKKYVPPETTANIFWLKNRHSDRWKDRKAVDISGSLNVGKKPQTLEDIREAPSEVLATFLEENKVKGKK